MKPWHASRGESQAWGPSQQTSFSPPQWRQTKLGVAFKEQAVGKPEQKKLGTKHGAPSWPHSAHPARTSPATIARPPMCRTIESARSGVDEKGQNGSATNHTPKMQYSRRRAPMMKKLAPLIAAAVFLFPRVGAAQVKIGFINSITGSEAPIGENLTNGVKLAVEDLAKKGIKVQLVQQDDNGKPQVAMTAMEQLATGDEVAVMVGPYTSADANAVAKLAQKYKVPQIIPAASKEDITRQGFGYVFRLNAAAHDYAQSLIDAALSMGSPKSVAFIYESTDFGTSVTSIGKEYATKKGLKVVADEAYQKGTP